jgi:hypothetical protein
MKPEDFTDLAFELLNLVLEEGHALSPSTADLKGSQAAFAYRHGSNVFHLGNDMTFLLAQGRHVGAKMLVRSMIESMFNVSASFKLPLFHIEAMIGELEETLKWLKNTFPNPQSSVVDAIDDSQAQLDDLRTNFGAGISSKRWKQVKEIAIAGNMERFYNKDYAYFCDYTHGGITSLLRQEEGIGVGNARQTGTMTMLVTASLLCGILAVKDSVKTLKMANELIKEFANSVNRGDFAY